MRRERRELELRKDGQLAELLGEALAGESPAALGRLALEPFSKRMNLSEQRALSFRPLATKELIAEC
jgi:hypothetical protein